STVARAKFCYHSLLEGFSFVTPRAPLTQEARKKTLKFGDSPRISKLRHPCKGYSRKVALALSARPYLADPEMFKNFVRNFTNMRMSAPFESEIFGSRELDRKSVV